MIYESGLGWQILNSGSCSAAIAPADELIGDERNPVFLIFIQNTSDREFLFRPEQIGAHSGGRDYTVLGQGDLKYLALEREHAEQIAASITGALAGLSTALSGTVYSNGSYSVSGPAGAMSGTVATSTYDPGAASRGAWLSAQTSRIAELRAHRRPTNSR